MRFNTKVLNEDGKELDIQIKLDLYAQVTVETDDDLSQFEEGEILTVVIYGEKGMFGTPVFANIDVEVYKLMGGNKILTIKEFRK